MSSQTSARSGSPIGTAPIFVSDIASIRTRAGSAMADGAVTSRYGLDADTVVRMLNDALATEIVCTLRYRRHYFCAEGIHSESVKKAFLAHANQELAHADKIAERIAIESYLEMIQFVSDRDPTTRRMLEAVLADEEEHAENMASLLKRIGS
jgi:bacterioferritin